MLRFPRLSRFPSLCIVVVAVLAVTVPGELRASSEGAVRTLGVGSFVTNDSLVDGRDRWRTGSYTLGILRGREWAGRPPARPGALLEYRFHGEMIAPRRISIPVPPGDRRPVGILSLGLHTHFSAGPADLRVGADIAAIGPQTGVARFQDRLHAAFGFPRLAVLDQQLPDAFHFTVSAELGREWALGGDTRLRPFVEVQAGVETFLRGGVDVVIGGYGAGGLMLRDPVSGQRVRAIEGTRSPGGSLVLGGDVAHVFSSAYLPPSLGPGPRPLRARARLGMNLEGERGSIFYGLTWLGPEFEGQPAGQALATLSLRYRF